MLLLAKQLITIDRDMMGFRNSRGVKKMFYGYDSRCRDSLSVGSLVLILFRYGYIEKERRVSSERNMLIIAVFE